MEPDISILRKTGHFYFALTWLSAAKTLDAFNEQEETALFQQTVKCGAVTARAKGVKRHTLLTRDAKPGIATALSTFS
jgi:hypothetical protein